MVMVDDSHAVGFMGEIGAGTPEHCGVVDGIDIITGTLGKALGGASGGYTAGKKEIIEWLRQRSRPYLFSNALAPVISSASVDVLKLIQSDEGKQRLATLRKNSQHFRSGMADAGFELIPGEHPIIPVMLYDAKLASDIAQELLAEGIYVIAFRSQWCLKVKRGFVHRCLRRIPRSKSIMQLLHLCEQAVSLVRLTNLFLVLLFYIGA